MRCTARTCIYSNMYNPGTDVVVDISAYCNTKAHRNALGGGDGTKHNFQSKGDQALYHEASKRNRGQAWMSGISVAMRVCEGLIKTKAG